VNELWGESGNNDLSVVIGVQWQWRHEGIDVMVAVVVMALLLEVDRASLLVISMIHFGENYFFFLLLSSPALDL